MFRLIYTMVIINPNYGKESLCQSGIPVQMSKYRQPNPLEELAAEYKSWRRYYEYGGQDPSWSDGTNLNLIRNHIIYYKRLIEEKCPQYLSSELYQQALPPEVDPNYMARTDAIRTHAQESLQLYAADPYLQYLRYHRDELSPKEIRKCCIDNVIGYASILDNAIYEDDLVTMRRHEFPGRYLESFRDCATRVKECLDNAEPNLFSLAASADKPGFDYPQESQDDDSHAQSMA